MNIKEIRLHNNYDFLRVFAALSITFTHSYNLIAYNEQEPLMQLTSGNFDFSFIGLCIFFSISGYLVTKSAATSVSIKNFVWKRFLRIQPVLIVLCFLTIFVLGPLYSTDSTIDYFKNFSTWSYFRNIVPVFGAQFYLPGLFLNHTDAGVNGSLWTLVVEERLYCVIGLSMIFGIRKGKWLIYAVFLLNLIYVVNILMGPGGIFPYLNLYYIQYALMFLNAAAYYNLKIPFEKYGKYFFITALFLSLFVLQYNNLIFLWVLIIPIAILGFAYIKIPLNKTGYFGDFTYGIYIFSFPVQQALISYFQDKINPIQLFIYTLCISVPLSIISWHLLEKKCLSYKNALK